MENGNEKVVAANVVEGINVADLKKKYGKIYEVNTEIQPEGEYDTRELAYYFVKPKTASFNRYIKETSKDAMRAMNTFIKDNIVEEQLVDFEEKLEDYPAIGLGMGEKLLAMLGLPKNTNFKLL